MQDSPLHAHNKCVPVDKKHVSTNTPNLDNRNETQHHSASLRKISPHHVVWINFVHYKIIMYMTVT